MDKTQSRGVDQGESKLTLEQSRMEQDIMLGRILQVADDIHEMVDAIVKKQEARS